jgi:elongation factor G
LDAVIDYLPLAMEVPAVKGTDPKSGEELVRNTSLDEPLCA